MRKIFSIAAGFSLLALMLYGGYVSISVAWAALAQANPQFSGTVLAAAATLIVAVLTVFGGKILERKAAISKELRDKKCPIYEKLVKFMMKVLMGTGDENGSGLSVTQEEMKQFFSEFTPELMVWGSDSVVAAWSRSRQPSNRQGKEVLLAVENVLTAIRRDLGHTNAALGPGDLLGLFLNDAKDVLGSAGAAKT